MSFGGVAEYSANKDIKLRIAVDAAVSNEAGMLRLAETIRRKPISGP